MCFSLSQSCLHTPSTLQNAALPDSHILDPVSQIQTEGKGEEGTEIQTTALNIYMDSSERECVYMRVCVRFLSRHVCTHLLTYTVYSWLGCEPGALKSCVAFPHRFLTPTTMGHSLCLGLGVGGGRSAVSYSAVFRPLFSFFFLHCIYFSISLSFNSFL